MAGAGHSAGPPDPAWALSVVLEVRSPFCWLTGQGERRKLCPLPFEEAPCLASAQVRYTPCRGVEKAPATSQHPTLVMLGEDAGWGFPTGPSQASDTQFCLHVVPGVFPEHSV